MSEPHNHVSAESLDLKPCPFCGATKLSEEGSKGWPVVQCDDCGACGPCINLDRDKANATWNARITDDAQAAVVRDDVIEQIAHRLAECYPENANTNEFCAAIRSMKLEAPSPPQCSAGTEEDSPLTMSMFVSKDDYEAEKTARIVSRLRNFAVWNNRQSHYEPVPLCKEAADEIEKLRRNLRHWREECGKLHARMPNEPQSVEVWQPIETAPKDSPIMLCVEGYLPSVGRWWPVDSCWASFDWEGHFDSDKEMTDYVNGTSYEPTHWKPLPAGPSVSRPQLGSGK